MHAHGQITGERLPSPDVCRVLDLTGQVVALGVEHPAHRGIVGGDAQRDAKDLGEEDSALRHVGVMPDLLVLEHVLRSIPSSTRY